MDYISQFAFDNSNVLELSKNSKDYQDVSKRIFLMRLCLKWGVSKEIFHNVLFVNDLSWLIVKR